MYASNFNNFVFKLSKGGRTTTYGDVALRRSTVCLLLIDPPFTLSLSLSLSLSLFLYLCIAPQFNKSASLSSMGRQRAHTHIHVQARAYVRVCILGRI